MSDETWSQRRTSFGSAAADYASGRPHYPHEALEWALPPDARTVLDLGAGTGILTADLLALDRDLEVTAVEPLAEMRELIPKQALALGGTAEEIPLEDATVDAVFVGQAWHWFDAQRALVEARRVLRPGGNLAMLWNLIDTSDPVSRAIADITEADERSDMMLDGEAAPPFDVPELFSRPTQLLTPHLQGYDAERIISFGLSRSQAILLDPDGQERLAERLRAAVPTEPFAVTWFCEAWRAAAI